jgi:hypothetical protein
MLKRLLAFLFAVLGLFGVIACIAGGYAVWTISSRLQQANEKAFTRLDQGLATVESRVQRVSERVRQAKITTDEIKDKLKDWATLEVKERIAARFEIEKRTEKVAGQLQVADAWLESSAESVRDAQHLLEVGQSLGARADPAALDDVLGHITIVLGEVREAEEAVAEFREFALVKEGEPEQNRLARALKLLARVLLTVTEADKRLERCVARLSEARDNTREMKERTSRTITLATIVCYVVLAWIALGQMALCWCGLRGCCRSRAPAMPTGT